MKILEQYLNQDEIELLSLIHSYRKNYEALKISKGSLNIEEIEIIKNLSEGEVLILNVALDRKKSQEEKQKPVLTQCPECEIEKERVPIGEEKNEKGFMCNIYHCDKCNIDYVDFKPNNSIDQLKWLDDFISEIENLKDGLVNMPDQLIEDIEQLKKQREIFLEACIAEKKALENVKQVEEKQAQNIAQLRDYLLAEKIRGLWSKSSMGEG